MAATAIASRTFHDLLRAADVGDVLTTELVSLTGKGKLRIEYDWLDSTLCCHAADISSFVWTINKVDDTTVTLSRAHQFNDMPLYASVRDDNSWYVQVQVPYSGAWITWAERDEKMTMTQPSGLLTVSFAGFNGSNIAVDAGETQQDDFSAYRVRSIGSSDSASYTWFMGVQEVLQSHLSIPLARELTEEHVRDSFAAIGRPYTSAAFHDIQRQLA